MTEKIVVVVPTLNEEEGIGLVVGNTRSSLKSYAHEILVVDGHSTDNTVRIAKDRGAHVISQRGKGYGGALHSGFVYAKEEMNADILVTMDGDGTYDAKDVPSLIQPILKDNSDLVVGKRVAEKDAMRKINILGNRMISWLVRRLLHVHVSDTQSGMFAFRSNLVDYIELKASGWAFNTEILAEAKHAGMRINEVPIVYKKRIGKGKLNFFRAGLTNLGVILRLVRDFEPLFLFGGLAAVLVGVGIFFGAVILVEWLTTGTMKHFVLPILSVLCIIAGIQLFSLGLMADMIKELRNRSKYDESKR